MGRFWRWRAPAGVGVFVTGFRVGRRCAEGSATGIVPAKNGVKDCRVIIAPVGIADSYGVNDAVAAKWSLSSLRPPLLPNAYGQVEADFLAQPRRGQAAPAVPVVAGVEQMGRHRHSKPGLLRTGLLQAGFGQNGAQHSGHLGLVMGGEFGEFPEVAGGFGCGVKAVAHQGVVAGQFAVPDFQLGQG